PRRGRAGARENRPEGQLRQSQLLTTFGPGAMVDLVDRAVVIGGLEHWDYGPDGFASLDDARLRRSLLPRLKALSGDLDLAQEGYFRMPPAGDTREPDPGVGVRALEFPRWFVCREPSCRRLARAADQFEARGGRYRHQCRANRWAQAVPVRFVAACKRGHLSDFPWIAFAHSKRGTSCDRPELYLREGATGDFGRIVVECRSCGSSVPLSQAMANLPYTCNGDRPWLGGRATNEPDCGHKLELLVRTASHAYFAQVVSALRLPAPEPDELTRRLQQKDVWAAVHRVTRVEQLAMLVDIQPLVESAVAGHDLDAVLAAIERERGAGAEQLERPLRSAEFERITGAELETPGAVPEEGVSFAAYRVPAHSLDLPDGVAGLVVVPELREVRVQVSFSRFDSVSADLQGEYDFSRKDRVRPATLTLPGGNEKWLPAAEVRGEGIFIELDEDAVQAWEDRQAVRTRSEQLRQACRADGREDEYPGVRFYLVHSLAHLLITAISLECGYSASAIRERIYCLPPGLAEPPMAAILLSTGTTGSEGTLGGLVEEGRRIRHHLREAWDLGRLCSSDPVCAAHDPASESNDRRTEGAACHGCLYIAECSCERFNRYLDRALVVPTIGNDPALAFFAERP
ncbi:MAG: DUF1998 domain-containing protein, partial [Myxococcota bacterium]